MSPNIAVRTSDFAEAVDFYTDVLGFKNRSDTSDLADLDAAPINIFILEDDEIRGPVLELFVEDID